MKSRNEQTKSNLRIFIKCLFESWICGLAFIILSYSAYNHYHETSKLLKTRIFLSAFIALLTWIVNAFYKYKEIKLNLK